MAVVRLDTISEENYVIYNMVQNKYLCGVSRGTRSRLQRFGGRVLRVLFLVDLYEVMFRL